MKQQRFGTTSEELSRIVQVCMGLARDWDGDPKGEAARCAFRALDTALECGIDVFDHADIYSAGKCEELFGHWLAANPPGSGADFRPDQVRHSTGHPGVRFQRSVPSAERG